MNRPRPTLTMERQLWQRGLRLVAGVDEVGRGSVAGPVVAAACVFPPDAEHIPDVRDSKMLSRGQRLKLFSEIRAAAIPIGVGAASRREIDHHNIRVATLLAMKRALNQLDAWDHALCDGPAPPELDPARHTGLVHGDAICASIAAASIIAKVVRDTLMERLAGRHPEYGWDRNAGYGTTEHLAALQRFGPTPHHRRSFAPVRSILSLSTDQAIP